MTSVGPKKILIVDDEPKSVVLLKRLLPQQYQTMGATDGHTVLDLTRQHCPDLILLDVMIPGLRSWHDATFVYASVSDTGNGMSEEIKDRIFEPFYTTKEVGKGTGLGLSVSSEIIKSHQGELLVESAVGVGTTFTVKLPRTQVAE